MSTSGANGAAFDASVRTEQDDRVQADRERLADEAEQQVELRKQTIKHLQDSLKVEEAEAKRLRAEAKENQR